MYADRKAFEVYWLNIIHLHYMEGAIRRISAIFGDRSFLHPLLPLCNWKYYLEVHRKHFFVDYWYIRRINVPVEYRKSMLIGKQ